MARPPAERAAVLPAIAEVFREHGYEGASLSLIGAATELGKGSLYHFFPRGKEEMAEAALAEIDRWFEREVYAPLRDASPPGEAIAAMFDSVDAYFRTGRRACLVGVLALGDARDRFADAIRSYFIRWVEALEGAHLRAGRAPEDARMLAEETVAGVQGAITLARALDDPSVFARNLEAMRKRSSCASS